MRPKEIVRRFLASMGRPDATERYLELFRAEKRERFALVWVTSAALAESSNVVVSDLRFLHSLELSPVLCVDSAEESAALAALCSNTLPIEECGLGDAVRVATEGGLPLLVAHGAEARKTAVGHLQPRKIVYLISQSGLQPEGKPVRSLINLQTDYDALVGIGGLRAEQAALLSEVRGLFAACAHTFTVSLTSAQDLLRELFTVKGAGTLVRRGTLVQRFADYDQLDDAQLTTLLHSAFGRKPHRQFFERPTLAIYLAAQYQGAAVLESAPLAPYLSKFAVDIRAQGEGIGGDLWHALTQENDRFFWRSRPKNPIAPWYASKCDGLVRGDDWTVYWRGLETSEIQEAVAHAAAAPIDFGEDH